MIPQKPIGQGDISESDEGEESESEEGSESEDNESLVKIPKVGESTFTNKVPLST